MEFLALADGLTPRMVNATGLRIPITNDTWTALDFKRRTDTALEIRVDWRSTRRPYPTAKLALVPMAGNDVIFEITFEKPERRRAFEIFPVIEPEERERLRQMLDETSSGDPVGEILFRDGTGTPLTGREFRIECLEAGCVQLKVVPMGDSALQIQIVTVWSAVPTPTVPTAMLSMIVQPHAANSMSVCVRETKGVLLR